MKRYYDLLDTRLKDGALLVNCGFMGGIDRNALLPELRSGRLLAAEDGPSDLAFRDLPLSVWYCSNSHTANHQLCSV